MERDLNPYEIASEMSKAMTTQEISEVLKEFPPADFVDVILRAHTGKQDYFNLPEGINKILNKVIPELGLRGELIHYKFAIRLSDYTPEQVLAIHKNYQDRLPYQTSIELGKIYWDLRDKAGFEILLDPKRGIKFSPPGRTKKIVDVLQNKFPTIEMRLMEIPLRPTNSD